MYGINSVSRCTFSRNMDIMPLKSFGTFILIVCLQCVYEVASKPHSSDVDKPFLLCEHPTTEYVEPFQCDEDGSLISHSLQSPWSKRSGDPQFLETVFVSIPRRKTDILLQLHVVDLHPVEAKVEWMDDNITYSEPIDKHCFYQGHVRGQERSSVALAACNGLSGYIQLMDEELLIESDGTNETRHVIQSCPIRNEDREPRRTPRMRRQTSPGRKYMEVVVAIDSSVVNLIGKNKVKAYILTIMNIVNRVYKDDSLTVDLEIVTSKILLMDKASERAVISSTDARRTVDKFCRWAAVQSYNNQYFGGGISYDVAVLLTRTGIGPAGYAPITGMCNPARSCAVVKDEGFTSAFILAHEVAHVIGLHHDGHGNDCQGARYQSAIMAPVVQASLRLFWWSSCSDERMKEMLPTLTCLNNNPFNGRTTPEPIPSNFDIGWSFDAQCRYEFGATHVACRTYYSDLCTELWCSQSSSPLCKTKRGRPLDGTPCGVQGGDMACEDGKCRYQGDRTSVDGGWDTWTNWDNCSSDCGVGTRQRTRKCDSPKPQYGGKPCEGADEEIDTCMTQECQNYQDLLGLQCTVLNALPVRDSPQIWLPYENEDKKKQCALTCISNNTGEVATFEDIPVENGTPCSYEWPYNICLNGKCVSVGCDGVTNSSLREDSCGVCGGNDSECKTVSGLYFKKLTYSGRMDDSYRFVLALPVGARNISIKEVVTSRHFLALKDPAYGLYKLNGYRRASKSKKFVANGAWFKYTNNRNYEVLKANGPLRAKLQVMVYPQSNNFPAQIKYSYTVQNDDYTFEENTFEWKYSRWTDCSVTCGAGTQKLLYNCFNKHNGKQVDDESCKYLKNPAGKPVVCQRTPCQDSQTYWALSREWTECSKSCGTGGIQFQNFFCEEKTKDGMTKEVNAERCSHIMSPNYTRDCNIKRCDLEEQNLRWEVAEWSECNATCESRGFQVAKLVCEQESGDGVKDVVQNSRCANIAKPQHILQCDAKDCNGSNDYKWFLSDWSKCSGSCDTAGFQTANMSCVREIDNNIRIVAAEKQCSHLPLPNKTRLCEIEHCQNYTYRWVISDWSGCSATCGNGGVEKLWHICEREADGMFESVNSDHCSGLSAPPKVRPCYQEPCYTFRWVVSQGSECSATCGEDGIQEVMHVCEQENDNSLVQVEDTFCQSIPKPQSTIPCNRMSCYNLSWVIANTSECSETCGNSGIKRLTYKCEKVFENGTVDLNVTTEDCYGKELPSDFEECNRIPCADGVYYWEVVDWAECSETCGNGGIQIPVISCKRRLADGTRSAEAHDEDPSLCGPVTSIPVVRECNRVPCFQEWQIGKWSECSVTCGSGVKTRPVYCLTPDKSDDTSVCPGEPPRSKRRCHKGSCRSSSSCVRDRIRRICSRSASASKCRYRGYWRMCCRTCRRYYPDGPPS